MYELWGRNRETKRYELITRFDDNRQSYFMLDQVDKDKYYEAMVLQGQHLIMYVDIKQPNSGKTRRLK